MSEILEQKARIRAGKRRRNSMFFPCTGGTEMTNEALAGNDTFLGALLDHANDVGYITVYFPQFFTRVVTFEVCVIPKAADADGMLFDLLAEFATEGEAHSTHGVSEGFDIVPSVVGQIEYIDLMLDKSGDTTFQTHAFLADDILGMKFMHTAGVVPKCETDLLLLGARLIWA